MRLSSGAWMRIAIVVTTVLLVGVAIIATMMSPAPAGQGTGMASATASLGNVEATSVPIATPTSAVASTSPAAVQPAVVGQLIRLEPEGEIHDLAAFPGGIVAVGIRFVDIPVSGIRVDAMSWTSTDGAAWARSPSARSARDGWMRAVAVRGDMILAVGDDVRTGAGAIWRSTDGLAWTRVATGSVFKAESIRDIVALQDGWLVATAHLSDPEGRTTDGGRLYGSTDGVHWTYRNGTARIFKGAHVRILATTARGLVAVGSFGGTDVNGGGEFAVAFASADSLRWRVAWDLPAHRYSSAGDVVAIGDRTVAMGGVNGGWTSVDDDHWTTIADPDIAVAAATLEGDVGPYSIEGAVATEGKDGVVAIGGDRLEWSANGTDWSAVPVDLPSGVPLDPNAGVVLTMLRGPNGLIAAGALGGPMLPQSQPAVWLLPDPTAP
jgi:hypothetical protein